MGFKSFSHFSCYQENDKKATEIDPFWAATCDKFMEQLRSGGDSTKRRGRKKKTRERSKPEGPLDDDESKEATMSQPSETAIKPEDIKREIVEVDQQRGHGVTEDFVEETKDKDVSIVVKSEPKETTNVKEEVKEAEEVKQVAQVKEVKRAKQANIEAGEEEDEEEEGDREDDDEVEKNSGEESDELPLIKRTARKKYKKTESDCDDEVICRKRRIRRGSRIKLESSSGSESSSDEESDTSAEFARDTSVAHRLRARKRSSTSAAVVNEGMKLRSRDTTPHKVKQDKENKISPPAKGNAGGAQKLTPKPLFGDGSDFRPGWEAEVYVYKKSLRMPPRLITVSKPSRFHRLSTSLPDLDPGSPALSVSMDSSDLCLGRKRNVDSDLESNYSFSISGLGTGSSKIDDEEATSSTTISCPPKTSGRHNKLESNSSGSIVDLLARKVGGAGKKDAKKKLKEKLERGGKVLPKATNEPELLPTPNLTPLVSTEMPTKVKGKTPVKNNKSTKPINVTDSYLLGYFRKETVNNFRNTFKNNHALPNEFSTFVLKSRTRTETRVLKKQATIREVFGEERPASAPPMQNHAGDTSQDDDSQTETPDNLLGRTRKLKQKVVTRLRNVGILRSQKAIMNSKRHLLTAKKRKDLIKSLAAKTLETLKKQVKKEEEEQVAVATAEEEDEEEEEEPEINKPEGDNNDDTEIPNKKKLKLRTGRRKFRSGFDYIRKKKKPLKKEDTTPKERKRVCIRRTFRCIVIIRDSLINLITKTHFSIISLQAIITRPNAECVADIQTEIRTWVIKKGVGETILHRAARLGYTVSKKHFPPARHPSFFDQLI